MEVNAQVFAVSTLDAVLRSWDRSDVVMQRGAQMVRYAGTDMTARHFAEGILGETDIPIMYHGGDK